MRPAVTGARSKTHPFAKVPNARLLGALLNSVVSRSLRGSYGCVPLVSSISENSFFPFDRVIFSAAAPQ
jgi:hypothetical protein